MLRVPGGQVRGKDEKTRSRYCRERHWELTQHTPSLRLAGSDEAAYEVDLEGRGTEGPRRVSEDGKG